MSPPPPYDILPIYYDNFKLRRNVFFVRKKTNFLSVKDVLSSPLFRKCALVILMFIILGYFIYQDVGLRYTAPITFRSAYDTLDYHDVSSKIPTDSNAFRAPKIAIVTYYTPDDHTQMLKARSFPNFQQYAEKFGYDVIDALADPAILSFYEDEYKKDHTIIHYLKFFVLSFILPKYDWVMWADGDSLFLNQSIPLTTFISGHSFDAIFTVNPFFESVWSRIINSGHYFLRNSAWTRDILLPMAMKMSRSCTNFFKVTNFTIPAPFNGVFEVCDQTTGEWWSSDQGVLQYLLDEAPESFQCHIQRRGFRDFNSEFPWYEDGDFVLHFPGTASKERLELMDLVLKNANFSTGIIDRTGPESERLNTEFNDRNVAGMYDSFYSFLNHPCRHP